MLYQFTASDIATNNCPERMPNGIALREAGKNDMTVECEKPEELLRLPANIADVSRPNTTPN